LPSGQGAQKPDGPSESLGKEIPSVVRMDHGSLDRWERWERWR
jgi:hypothetical protein